MPVALRRLRRALPALLALVAAATASVAALFASVVAGEDVLSYVDPFIGSGGVGFGIGSNPPGPQMPFGMMRLSPDTINAENVWIRWNHFSGYYYPDDTIRAFSHMRLVGAGAADLGLLGVLPVRLPRHKLTDQTYWRYFVENYAYRSKHSKADERASAGYYRANLTTHGVVAELTAQQFSGAHRYTFSKDHALSARAVLFDVSHTLPPGACKDAQVSVDPDRRELSGFAAVAGPLSGRFGGVKMFFAVRFDASWQWARDEAPFGTFDRGNTSHPLTPGGRSARGPGIGAFVQVPLGVDRVTMYVGISLISVEQARANLDAEMGASPSSMRSFDELRAQAEDVWRRELSRIAVATPNRNDLVKFYSAYYHAICTPTIYSETGGNYMGFDNAPHSTGGLFRFMSDVSIWDVHRTQIPFVNLMFGKDRSSVSQYNGISHDLVKSMLLMAQQGPNKSLPKWPLANGEGGSMFGTHVLVCIADALLKNGPLQVEPGDMEQLRAHVLKHATQDTPSGRSGMDEWTKLGYISYEHTKSAACHTTAYAYDDFAVAQFLQAFYPDDRANIDLFTARSRQWRGNFHPKEKFFCPRGRDGTTWHCPPTWIDLFTDGLYVEGDAYHYRWFVPHEPLGLIKEFGGVDHFVHELEYSFNQAMKDPVQALPNPWYWAGNEHDLFQVWMFNYANRTDLTAKHSRWLLDNRYGTGPDGLPGNDDYGTMSAWFMFASMGFYPVTGTTTYAIGSPLFQHVSIEISSRCTVDITVTGYCPACVVVEQVKLNGGVLREPFVDHAQLTCRDGAGKVYLEFVMKQQQ